MSKLATMKPTAKRMRPMAAMLMQVLLVLGASSGLARAQPELQSYDVELIIFKTLSSDATAENGPRGADTGPAFSLSDDEPPSLDTEPFDTGSFDADADADNAIRMTAPSAENFPALPAARYQLSAIAGTLRRSRNYRPLAHFGWTQPGYPRHATRFLSIDSMVPAGSGLSGRVALTRGRYLHLALDLALQETGTSADQRAIRHVLHQSRRMRSNERHYIDHPNFGVIALITPSSE